MMSWNATKRNFYQAFNSSKTLNLPTVSRC
jgi:hypothetical protein